MFLRLDPQSPNLPKLGVRVPAKHTTAMSKVPPPGTGEPTPSRGLKMTKVNVGENAIAKFRPQRIWLLPHGSIGFDPGSWLTAKLHLCATPNNIGCHEIVPRTSFQTVSVPIV